MTATVVPAEEGHDCFTVSAPVRELVVGVPAPSSHHRKHESPTLDQEHSVEVGIAHGDLVGHVGNVELDWAAAACLEVDEDRPVPGIENVALVRFSVQQLIRTTAESDGAVGVAERVGEKVAVGVSERRRRLPVKNQSLSFGDAIGEVRRHNVEVSHADVESVKSVRVRSG